MKKYKVVHFINHVQKDYTKKECMKLETAIKYYQDFYMYGYGFLNLGTTLLENHSDEKQQELIAISFVQNNDYKYGEEGFLNIFKHFVDYYIEMTFRPSKNVIQIPTTFDKTFVVKPSQCDLYREALMAFVEMVFASEYGDSVENVLDFEKEKLKEFDYYYDVKKRSAFKCADALIAFAKKHPQITIGDVVFEFKYTSKNTALMNLYFGEKGKELIEQL